LFVRCGGHGGGTIIRKRRITAIASVLAMTLAASAGCAKNEPAGDGVTTTEFVGEPATVGDEEFTPEQNNLDEKTGAHGSYGVGDFGEKNESGIREITYEFSYGEKWSIILGDTSTLEVKEWGDSENAFLGGTVELNAEEVSKLQEIYEKHKLWRWDAMIGRRSLPMLLDLRLRSNTMTGEKRM